MVLLASAGLPMPMPSWPEESVSERAGTLHLRVAEPSWHLPVLVLGHGLVLPVYGGP